MPLKQRHLSLQEVSQTFAGDGSRPFAQSVVRLRQAVQQFQMLAVQAPPAMGGLQHLTSLGPGGCGDNLQMQDAGIIEIRLEPGTLRCATHRQMLPTADKHPGMSKQHRKKHVTIRGREFSLSMNRGTLHFFQGGQQGRIGFVHNVRLHLVDGDRIEALGRTPVDGSLHRQRNLSGAPSLAEIKG